MSQSDAHSVKQTQDWTSALVRWVSGLLFFETLTGLVIYLAPFSVTTQVAVLCHTIVGLPFIIPSLVYIWKHFSAYRGHPLTHYKLTGYVTALAFLSLVVSGLVLSLQAAASTRISWVWRDVHIAGTFVLLAFAMPHLILLLFRAMSAGIGWGRGEPVRLYVRGSLLVAVAFSVAWGAWSAAGTKPMAKREFPADYSKPYGDDRPFAPSLARTDTNGPLAPESLAGSAACGSSGCHQEIYEEWLPSAHRYAAMDPVFQAVQATMGKQNGPESTRYCGGCHDPISLFSGTKNIFVENLTGLSGFQEGISCAACHSIRETDIKGNAAYVITEPQRYLYESSGGKLGKFASDFLIRAYPDEHNATYSRRMFKTPEFCAACHKQFVDQEVNNVGWVQLQNQYDNWRKSRWNHPDEPDKTIECRECHMPLRASTDPGAGDPVDKNRDPYDGKHRSHAFLGANQWIPKALDLPGGEEHVKETEKWLRGELRIPEIQGKWVDGPAVPIELTAPKTAKPGENVPLRVVITSNKVGHDFPTGPLDLIQVWVQLEVRDDSGRLVYSTGKLNEKNFVPEGSFMFKAEPVDQYGNLIDKHNLWDMVGVRFRRALFPGFADTVEFAFACPGALVEAGKKTDDAASGDREEKFEFAAPADKSRTLTVSAKLMYRKLNQFLVNFTLGEDPPKTAPVTVIAEATAKIEIEGS